MRLALTLLAASTLCVSACAQEPAAELPLSAQAAASDADYRVPDPENTLYIDTSRGRVVVELYPEIAPGHVEQIKTLARQGFYDGVVFHRVIDGFMNQTGDPTGTGTGDSDLPDLAPEFTFRRGSDMPMDLFGMTKAKDGSDIATGFYKALPVASQPSSQAMLTKDGKVEAYGLHCTGVMSMARTQDPASANSQFFLMRGKAPHLDTQYSVWGVAIAGRDILDDFTVGTVGQDPGYVPDVMEKMVVAADVAEAERENLRVMRTDSEAFQTYLERQRTATGYPDICEIEVPTVSS